MVDMKPENRALQDRLEAVLAAAHPATLTVREIVARLDAHRTLRAPCVGAHLCRERTFSAVPLATFDGHERDGAMTIDVWTVPVAPHDLAPMFGRLLNDGLVSKAIDPLVGAQVWRWTGPLPTEDIEALEAMWNADPLQP